MEKVTLKAVGYRRVSMREQVDGHSLDAQEKNIRDYAKAQGWQLIEIYTDAGISAKKDTRKPVTARRFRCGRKRLKVRSSNCYRKLSITRSVAGRFVLLTISYKRPKPGMRGQKSCTCKGK